jgi:hypothetical protein
MNAFLRHHAHDIAFSYRCFDRIVCNAYIQRFLWRDGVYGFLRHERGASAINPAYFRSISTAYHRWLEAQIAEAGLPIIEPPADVRREEWVEPYYRALGDRAGARRLDRAGPPTDPRSGRRGCVSLLLRPDLARRLTDHPQVVEGAKHGGAVAGDPGVAPQVQQGHSLQR